MAEATQKYAFYPNEAVPDEIKDTSRYGASVGEYIYNQWFGGNERYYTRRNEFVELRQHMKGFIDISEFLDLMGVDKDRSWISLNLEPPRLIAKYVNTLVGSLSANVYKIKANGVDPISNANRMVYSDMLRREMYTTEYTNQMTKFVGVQNQGMQVPESEEELDIMLMDYNTASEVIAETSINRVLTINKYDEIKSQVDEDLVLLGEGGVRVRRDGARVRYERVVPENFVYSYDTQDSRDGRGTLYYGHVRQVSIADLKHRASAMGEPLTNKDIQTLVGGGYNHSIHQTGQTNSSYNNYVYSETAEDEQQTVLIIDFCYKTTNHLTYKKKYNRHGGYKLIERESDFKAKYDKLQEEYDVWYEGWYIPGISRAIGYRKMNDQKRKASNLKDVYDPYVYYRLSTESVGKRILPYVKQLFIIYLKMQQLVAKLKPDGVDIDLAGLNNINVIGMGKLTPADLIKYYNQTGDRIWDSRALDSTFDASPPIKENPGQFNTNRFSGLIGMYNHWIQMIRDDTGLNEVADASTPSGDALVGVQKLALIGSKNATKHIYDGMLDITRRVAESTIMTLQIIAKYDSFDEQLVNLIGGYDSSMIKEFNSIGNYEYAIDIELEPEEEEKLAFSRRMEMAIQQRAISLEDSINIDRIDNLKLKAQMLKIKAKKFAQQMSIAREQDQMAQQQAQQQAYQLEMQKQQQLTELKIAEDRSRILTEAKAKMDVLKFEYQLKMQLGNPDLQDKIRIEDKKKNDRIELEQFKEDRKDERQNKTASQNSQMIEQRKADTGAIDFDQQEAIKEFI